MRFYQVFTSEMEGETWENLRRQNCGGNVHIYIYIHIIHMYTYIYTYVYMCVCVYV